MDKTRRIANTVSMAQTPAEVMLPAGELASVMRAGASTATTISSSIESPHNAAQMKAITVTAETSRERSQLAPKARAGKAPPKAAIAGARTNIPK